MNDIGKEYNRINHEIHQNNFALVQIPVSREELEEAAASFINFLDLPLRLKTKFHCEVDASRKGSDVGYVRRKKVLGSSDNKQFFHYNLYAEDSFEDLFVLNNPKIENFYTQARRVYTAVSKSVSDILKILDSKHQGLYNQFFQPDIYPNFFLRFLAYDNAGEGDFLADAHYDRGTYTLALGESVPGLRIGRGRDDLKEVQYHPDKALFFRGLQKTPGIDDGFQPAWHDVVQQPGQTYNDKIARWAIVCFIDPLAVGTITTEQTHTPIKTYNK